MTGMMTAGMLNPFLVVRFQALPGLQGGCAHFKHSLNPPVGLTAPLRSFFDAHCVCIVKGEQQFHQHNQAQDHKKFLLIELAR